MPLPIVLAALAVPVVLVGTKLMKDAIASADDDVSDDWEALTGDEDDAERERREYERKQKRKRRDSIRRDARSELRRIVDRHNSTGRVVAPSITIAMLRKAVSEPDDCSLDLLMPRSLTTRGRDSGARKVRELADTIQVLKDLSSAVQDLAESYSISAASRSSEETHLGHSKLNGGISQIRRLERKLPSSVGREDGSRDDLSQNIDDLVLQVVVEPDSSVRIVACGMLCAGKSSLLNALTDHFSPEFFPTGGGRTTRDCRSLLVRLGESDCRFSDTPGIDVAADDDATAYEEVSAADHLLFVHTLSTGELNSAEVKFLKQVASKTEQGGSMPGLTVVLTHLESHEDDAERLEKTILAQTEKVIGHRVACFLTSATAYKKGCEESKQLLLSHSRIKVLRDHCTEVADDIEGVRKGRIKRSEWLAERVGKGIDTWIADLKRQRERLLQKSRRREAAFRKDFRRFLESVGERMETL